MTPRKRIKNDGLPSRVYRHGKGFRLRVYIDGEPKWQSLQARTVGECWAEIEAMNRQREGTIGAGIERYIEHTAPALIRERKLSPNTWRTEKRRAEALKPVFGHMQPADLTTPELYEFADRVGDGWRKLKRFSVIWRYMMRWGMAGHDPFHRLQWPKQNARKRYVTDEEVTEARLIALEQSEQRPSALMVWAALLMIELTGRRVTDVRKLTLRQIKDDGIHFRESKTEKGIIVQRSPELDIAITAIKERLHKGRKIQPMALICNRDGQMCSEGSLNQAWQRLRPALNEAGIEPFQLRDIRAKYGTDHEDGRDALNHSSEAVYRKHYNRKSKKVEPLR